MVYRSACSKAAPLKVGIAWDLERDTMGVNDHEGRGWLNEEGGRGVGTSWSILMGKYPPKGHATGALL